MLSDEHKRQRVEISQILLHRCQQGGDETVDVGPGGDHRARNKLLVTLEHSGDKTRLNDMEAPVRRKFFTQGIYSLLPRWQKCIAVHGDYIESLSSAPPSDVNSALCHSNSFEESHTGHGHGISMTAFCAESSEDGDKLPNK
ncbi:hypothetical protein PoB_003228100 [Plakobranchus ocellatus]|uniref:Uncharacterized protein n=1 Tax=Plakobranchus ocellatus TaxID=259542 RepID=A0AAV4AGL8_9GAST|nr:hypothetical protein PoB_003228100 [Plakobranchus ocellatus]